MSRVLITDDSPFFRIMMKQIVTSHGYSVVAEASDGIEAVKQYNIHRPDIVTMDITMPEMNGLDAARAILALHPGARIVMVSSSGQETVITEAINLGAKGFVVKPVQPEKLLSELNQATNS